MRSFLLLDATATISLFGAVYAQFPAGAGAGAGSGSSAGASAGSRASFCIQSIAGSADLAGPVSGGSLVHDDASAAAAAAFFDL